MRLIHDSMNPVYAALTSDPYRLSRIVRCSATDYIYNLVPPLFTIVLPGLADIDCKQVNDYSYIYIVLACKEHYRPVRWTYHRHWKNSQVNVIFLALPVFGRPTFMA